MIDRTQSTPARKDNMKEILELSQHNCLVRAYVESYRRGHVTWDFMCERLIICLADQNKTYFDLAVEANSRAISKPMFIPSINSDRFN